MVQWKSSFFWYTVVYDWVFVAIVSRQFIGLNFKGQMLDTQTLKLPLCCREMLGNKYPVTECSTHKKTQITYALIGKEVRAQKN
jgi:hypothetical protein